MTMDSEVIRVERDGGVAHLVLDRPDKANAMAEEFWHDLPAIIHILDADPAVRAVVISAEGKHFTAGIDLSIFTDITKLFEGEPGRAAYSFRKKLHRLQDSFTAMERSRLPVIAAVHGGCVGGGIDMITAVDIRLASTDAWFAVEEINVGMAADVGTLQRLPKIVSPGIAKELCFTGRRFSAEEAKGFGLINEVHSSPETCVEAALKLAHEIAAKSPLAIAGIKQSLNYALDHTVEEGLDQIATWNSGMLRAEDLMEAMRARMAKEKGRFKGVG